MIPLWLKWLHIIGLVMSLGSGLTFLLVMRPAANTIEAASERLKVTAKLIGYFHPLYLLGICTLFMSGAWGLTQLKIGLGSNYFEKVSAILYWKFGLTTVIFLVASMQCFGQGLKLTRMVNGIIPGDIDRQEYYVKKITRATFVNVILLAVTLYVGLKMPEVTR